MTPEIEKRIIDHDHAIAALRIVAEAMYEIPPSLPLPPELPSALKGAVKAVVDTHNALTAELE